MSETRLTTTIDPAAVIAGEQPHGAADDIGDSTRDRRHRQHGARAPDEAREDVAALVVGPSQ